MRCTKKTVLDSHLATLSSADLIVTSVLENFITDVCNGVAEDEVQLFARQQLTAHVDSLSDLVHRLSSLTVMICPPMYRSTPAWFGPYLGDLQAFLRAEVARIGSRRIEVCDPFIVLPSLLESDGVHLCPSGGDRFLAHMDAQLTLFLNRLQDDSMSIDLSHDLADAGPSDATPRLQALPDSFDTLDSVGVAFSALSRATSSFEAFTRRRFKADDLIFARLKEESDADVNKSREDRVVITGLSPSPPSASSHLDKKKHFCDVITRLVTIACAVSDPLPKVVDVYLNIRKDKGQPLVEARFDTASGAQQFRREGVRLAKANHAEFDNLFFANSVTQSTRVRIEVLKALAKRLTTEEETAFVQGFISRPLLQYRVQEGASSSADGVGRGYNYVDAVAKFGARLTPRDLSTAYVRAGSTFAGAMSQYFVVLRDDLVGKFVRSGANSLPLGQRGGRGGRGGRGSRGFRGSRGGRLPFSDPDVSSIRPLSASGYDRGTKRPGDPTGTPSKRNESELNVVSE